MPIIYIANPAFGTRGLYVSVVRALGGSPRFFRAEVMAQAQILEAEEAERHRRVVIVVDEAHLLTPAQLTITTPGGVLTMGRLRAQL
jgi:type II secretory pathway predicted ATPase ExeA